MSIYNSIKIRKVFILSSKEIIFNTNFLKQSTAEYISLKKIFNLFSTIGSSLLSLLLYHLNYIIIITYLFLLKFANNETIIDNIKYTKNR